MNKNDILELMKTDQFKETLKEILKKELAIEIEIDNKNSGYSDGSRRIDVTSKIIFGDEIITSSSSSTWL